MKKAMKILALLAVCLMGVALWSCDDDDDTKVNITYETLPEQAKTFITSYYPGIKILSVERSSDKGTIEYEVLFQNNQEVTFDNSGLWVDVDAPIGQTIPDGIAPRPIADYVTTNYPDNGINEISRERNGYDVDLVDGTDLIFDTDGNFIRIDR